MENYSCPICGEHVPLVANGRITDGGRLVGPTPEGLLIEKKRCRACGEPLERISGYRWHVEGSLGLDPVFGPFTRWCHVRELISTMVISSSVSTSSR
jgi:hypothetical protein